jgi:hypothetical protein
MRSAGRIRPWSTTPGSPSARSGLLFYPVATESSQSTGRPVARPSHFRSIISSGMSDIAIAHSSPEQMRVVSRCPTDHRTYVYASRAYLSEAAPIAAREDLKKHPFIGFVDELLFPPEVRFSDAIGANPASEARTSWRNSTPPCQEAAFACCLLSSHPATRRSFRCCRTKGRLRAPITGTFTKIIEKPRMSGGFGFYRGGSRAQPFPLP